MPTPYDGPALASNIVFEKAVKYVFNLKSRWDGDQNYLRAAHIRTMALNASDKTIISDGEIAMDIGDLNCRIVPYTRAPLAHSVHSGLGVISGNGYVKATPTEAFRTMAFMVRPLHTAASSTSQVAVGNGTTGAGSITFTKNGTTEHYYTITHTGTTGLYINGSSVTSGANIYIPFPILIVVDFSATFVDARFGNSYTGTGAVGPMQIDYISMMNKYISGTISPFAASDFALFTDLFYRKPQGSTFVEPGTPIVATGPSAIVPNPESWPVVSSS